MYNYYKDSDRNSHYKFIYYENIGLPNDDYSYLSVSDNYAIAKKDGKAGVIDINSGKIVIPFEYDNVILEKDNLFLVSKNNKIGVVNNINKIIISLKYDFLTGDDDKGDFGEEVSDGLIITFNENHYFVLRKGHNIVVLNEDKDVLIECKSSEFNYISKWKKFSVINGDVQNYYSIDGKFLKSIQLDNDLGQRTSEIYSSNFLIYSEKVDNNKIYIIDENLNVKVYSDIYYSQKNMSPGRFYYISNDIYLKKVKDSYEVYSIKEDNIIGTYSYVMYPYGNVEDANFIVCKSSSQCGLMDTSGNLKTDLIYEYFRLGNDYLKNGNEYFFLPRKGNLTCNDGNDLNFDDFTDVRSALGGKFYIISYRLYSNNCREISDKKFKNIYELSNKMILAETTYDFDERYIIFDSDGLKINLDIPNDVKVYSYLGNVGNNYYFKTNSGIFYFSV